LIKYGIPNGFSPEDYHRDLDEILAKAAESGDTGFPQDSRLYIKLSTMLDPVQLERKMTI
jgi:sugar phosphate isomerase/epimerase